MKILVEQFEALGAPVSDDDLVVTLVGSLSESFALLITENEVKR